MEDGLVRRAVKHAVANALLPVARAGNFRDGVRLHTSPSKHKRNFALASIPLNAQLDRVSRRMLKQQAHG